MQRRQISDRIVADIDGSQLPHVTQHQNVIYIGGRDSKFIDFVQCHQRRKITFHLVGGDVQLLQSFHARDNCKVCDRIVLKMKRIYLTQVTQCIYVVDTV